MYTSISAEPNDKAPPVFISARSTSASMLPPAFVFALLPLANASLLKRQHEV
jgi:hypothetical protein